MTGDNDNKGAHGPEGQCDDVKKLKVEMIELKKQVDEINYQVKEHAQDLADIMEFQGGTKVYVCEIKDQLNRLEERLFAFMGDLVTNLTRKEETETVTEAKKAEALAATNAKVTTQKWEKLLNTIKEIVKLLAAAVVGYLASKGGP